MFGGANAVGRGFHALRRAARTRRSPGDGRARASRAGEVIDAEAMTRTSFQARIGKDGTHRGAPKYGSKALQDYTRKKKAAEGSSSSEDEDEGGSDAIDGDDEASDLALGVSEIGRAHV